jgi:hypothetical protein
MYRLTARLLLLFALAGNVIPLAMAAKSEPPRACCMRNAHHCHESSASETGPVLLDPCCCRNHARRATTTTIWVHPEELTSGAISPAVELLAERIPFFSVEGQSVGVHSSRAPPQLSIA